MARAQVYISVAGNADLEALEKAQKELDALKAKARETSDGMAQSWAASGKRLQEFGQKTSALGGTLTRNVTGPMLALGAGLVAATKKSEDAEIAQRKLANVLQSMGFGAATDRVAAYADQLEKTVAVDAEVIKATQTKLATFKNLTATIGEAGGAFDRATVAALDLAAAGFGSAETNAVQLGKALQDPIKGITALARAGVTFTDQEKEKIKQLTESNQILKAQDMILKAIEKQVGGTAEAGVSEFERMKIALENTTEDIGAAFAPIIESISQVLVNDILPRVSEGVKQLSSWFKGLSPTVQKVIVGFLAFSAAIGPVLIVVGKLAEAFGSILMLAPKIKAAFLAIRASTIAMNLAFLTNPVVLLTVAFVALIAIIVQVVRNSEGLQRAWGLLVDRIRSGLGSALTWVREQFNNFLNFFRNLPNQLQTVASNMAEGFMRGIANFGSRIWNAMTAPIQNAINAIRSILQISSPSKVTTVIGQQYGDGFVKGVQSKTKSAVDAANAMGQATSDALKGGLINLDRTIAVQMLEEKGILALGKKWKIGLKLITDAALGSEKAIAKLSQVIAKIKLENPEGWSADWEGNLVVDPGAVADMLKLQKALAAIRKEFKTMGTSNDRMNEALGTATQNLGNYLVGIDKITGETTKKAKNAALEALKVARDSARAIVQVARENLAAMQEQLETVQGKIIDMAASIKQSLMSNFKIDFGDEGEGVLESVRAQAAKMAEFIAKLKELQSLGLNQESLMEILNAGMEKGTEIANDVLAGGTEAITEINSLQSQLTGLTEEFGKTFAEGVFAEELKAAEESVKKAQEQLDISVKMRDVVIEAIEKVREKMGKTLKKGADDIADTSDALERALKASDESLAGLTKEIRKIIKRAQEEAAALQALLNQSSTSTSSSTTSGTSSAPTTITVAPGAVTVSVNAAGANTTQVRTDVETAVNAALTKLVREMERR